MAERRWIAGVTAVALVVAMITGYRWWTGDERAIRTRLSAIAEALTVNGEGGNLEAIGRIATLRNALAPDVRVSAGLPPATAAAAGARVSRDIAGRDAVLGLVGRWVPPPGGVTVEFVDVQVTVGEGGDDAEVYCTATIESGGASGPSVDARELTIGFRKLEGAWLVASVQVEDTLVR